MQESFSYIFRPISKSFSNLKFIKHQEKNQVVCRGLLTKNQTTRIGAFLKSCQMRKKSSVSPPNLIGEKRSHDFAAGGSWHAERALAAAAARIHSYSSALRTDRNAKPGYGTSCIWDVFISETGLQIGWGLFQSMTSQWPFKLFECFTNQNLFDQSQKLLNIVK